MIQTVPGVSTIQSRPLQSAAGTSAANGSEFASLLDQALQPVRASEAEAQATSLSLLTGEATSVHQVVLAAEKADLALQLTVQIRNKAMDAYNEIMRMQL
jgi:flagellar hook-basal body complex protein FliE